MIRRSISSESLRTLLSTIPELSTWLSQRPTQTELSTSIECKWGDEIPDFNMPRCANETNNSTSTISNADNLLEEFTVDDESCMFVANSSNILLVVNEPVNQQIFNCSSTDGVRIFPGKTLPPGILISEDGKLVGATETPMDPAVFKLCWADSTREVCIDSTLQVLSSLRKVEYPRDVLKLDKVVHVSVHLQVICSFSLPSADSWICSFSMFQLACVQDCMTIWAR